MPKTSRAAKQPASQADSQEARLAVTQLRRKKTKRSRRWLRPSPRVRQEESFERPRPETTSERIPEKTREKRVGCLSRLTTRRQARVQGPPTKAPRSGRNARVTAR